MYTGSLCAWRRPWHFQCWWNCTTPGRWGIAPLARALSEFEKNDSIPQCAQGDTQPQSQCVETRRNFAPELQCFSYFFRFSSRQQVMAAQQTNLDQSIPITHPLSEETFHCVQHEWQCRMNSGRVPDQLPAVLIWPQPHRLPLAVRSVDGDVHRHSVDHPLVVPIA